MQSGVIYGNRVVSACILFSLCFLACAAEIGLLTAIYTYTRYLGRDYYTVLL